ncbi:hypothetical protein AMAG_12988 [Allomyces macrogynus ATCC 38327]|uniref:GH26 domain-containing protein n=1 Tax=Allomyces macrogynus (strain ATCC 38327) TaxID=578462 RepID=A0A0L0T149_ALLM3|nr:hypothetical protein AMAG_12988 [Allomyces macrogynus ATCC 38327]|eukprot:KNE68324.1 hypothetical protein AMAG_12988 [Allomyces macrogynus ATCC 38327]
MSSNIGAGREFLPGKVAEVKPGLALWKRALIGLVALVALAAATIAILHAANVDMPFWRARKADADSSSPKPTATNTDNASATSTSTTTTTATPTPTATPVQPPENGVLFGAHIWGDGIDWAPKSPEEWNGLAGRQGAGFGAFVYVDTETGLKDPSSVLAYADKVKAVNGFLMLTVEPMVGGLDMMTDAVINKTVDILAEINLKKYVPILLRFAHEMNGAWYLWGQKPVKYRETWIRFAKAVRARAPATSLVFSPNTPVGYPWSGGTAAVKGSPDYKAMDTNGDGVVDDKDDPFGPYFPGEEWVDWISLSVFHFGTYPWGTNTYPNADDVSKFLFNKWSIVALAKQYKKPFGVFECGAVYYPLGKTPDTTYSAVARRLGSTDLTAVQVNAALKREWFRQLVGNDARALSNVKLVMWFEVAKTEEGGQVRDFTMFRDPEVARQLRLDFANYALVGAPGNGTAAGNGTVAGGNATATAAGKS